MTIINAATFELTEVDAKGFEHGTVEVTLGATTRRVPGWRRCGVVGARGMFGRYKSGAKLWPATVVQTVKANGEIDEWADFGRDDRSDRFNKANRIFFV
jgi:hypothetical protein